jgi:hypothetical protein
MPHWSRISDCKPSLARHPEVLARGSILSCRPTAIRSGHSLHSLRIFFVASGTYNRKLAFLRYLLTKLCATSIPCVCLRQSLICDALRQRPSFSPLSKSRLAASLNLLFGPACPLALARSLVTPRLRKASEHFLILSRVV